MVGYDWRDVGLELTELPVKASTYRIRDFEVVRDMGRTLPAFVSGVAFWKPEISPESVELSLRKRLYHKPPTPNHAILSRLRAFVHKWCRDNLKPLDRIKTFDEWIEETHYSQKRKQQLRLLRERVTEEDVFRAKVKCFVKDEFYSKPKAPRMISSREDKAKVILGPIFSSMEDIIYALPPFVKGLTSQQRVEKIHNMFGDRPVYVTDYSSFETHFHRKMMDVVEMQVYKRLLERYPNELRLVRVIRGNNHLVSKYFTGTLEAVRMSGEMNTSMGNGISNYLFMLFAARELGVEVRNMIVEGDDGLVELDADLSEELFEKMGLEIKLAPARACEASFCGCVYDPVTLHNFGHPLDLLAKIGWGDKQSSSYSARRRTELLVAKVYSAIAEFPGVPIVWKFCSLVLKNFRNITYARAMKYIDYYRTTLCQLSDVVVEPTLNDRLWFAHLTGLSPVDQEKIEREFDETFPSCYSETLCVACGEDAMLSWSRNVIGE